MKRIFKQEYLIFENRFFIASVCILVIMGLLLFRLWYIQIYKGSFYKSISENNRIRRIDIPAPRGGIYDRHGKTILSNKMFYDLVYIPQYINDKEATFKVLSRLMHIPVSVFERRIKLGEGRPKYLPIILKRNLSLHEVSTIESSKILMPGITVRAAPRRQYDSNIPSHIVGYLGEIDESTLKAYNKKEGLEQKYFPGDLVGKQGLEARCEGFLRGVDGHKMIQVDAFGREINVNYGEKVELPTDPARPGSDLELTLDYELQKAVQDAFKGKYGAVIVMDTRNGEILAMASEPRYDPSMYQRSLSREEWVSLVNNPFKPLFDKTTGGEYIPGSIYKSVVGIAALEEGIITPKTTHRCPGYYVLGDKTFMCHQKHGHGVVDLKTAMMKSCDVYFYHVGVELGVDKIAHYAKLLGLGKPLGVNLNMERPGLVPTTAWKKITYGTPWMGGDTPNIAIGQGYNLMTPIQMVSLYSVIANGGSIWRPFLVKRVVNNLGRTVFTQEPTLIDKVEGIKPETFELMRSYLQEVVMNKDGTGHRAKVEGVTVGGKTGSAQVVSLKRADKHNYDDISMRWKEHAIFAAFSPVEDSEIAVIVVSENDQHGGGGAQAAPVAQKIIKKYWELKEGTANAEE